MRGNREMVLSTRDDYRTFEKRPGKRELAE